MGCAATSFNPAIRGSAAAPDAPVSIVEKTIVEALAANAKSTLHAWEDSAALTLVDLLAATHC